MSSCGRIQTDDDDVLQDTEGTVEEYHIGAGSIKARLFNGSSFSELTIACIDIGVYC